jgi:hypothetical protein
MDAPLYFILSLSIVIAVLIGIIRFKKIDSSYYPFIYDITIVFIIEIAVYYLMQAGHPNILVASVNVFSLIDFCLFTWLFHNWRLFNHNRTTFISILSGFFVAWFLTTFFIGGITTPNLYFRILYSFTLIFFSVSSFNKLVVHDRTAIFRNPKFWICFGIVIFYTFFIIVCVAKISLFRHQVSGEFRKGLQEINVYSNLLVNLLYAVAVLWIPRKKNITSLF